VDTVLDHAELRADAETPTVAPKVEAQPIPPVTLDGITEQNQAEEAIKNEVLRTLSERTG
jgi:hypothetical protein